MKCSILFWPVVSAAAISVVWVGFCLLVVGLVIGVPTSGAPVAPRSTIPTFWSPAANLLNARQSGTLAGLLASAVNGFWRVAPYCRPSAPQPDPENHREELQVLVLLHHYDSGGAGGLRWGHMVVLRPKTERSWTPYLASILSVWPQSWVGLSRGEVLLYIFLIPGAHFALAAFILAGVGAVLVRLFMVSVPERAGPSSGVQEEEEQTR